MKSIIIGKLWCIGVVEHQTGSGVYHIVLLLFSLFLKLSFEFICKAPETRAHGTQTLLLKRTLPEKKVCEIFLGSL